MNRLNHECKTCLENHSVYDHFAQMPGNGLLASIYLEIRADEWKARYNMWDSIRKCIRKPYKRVE